MKLSYGVGAYRRQASRLPEIICKNQFVEQSPANLEEQAVLISRPGLTSSYTLGAGPIRGMFRQDGVLSGDKIAVSGGSLYRETTSLGAIAGAGMVEIAALSSTLFIATGTTFYSSDGATVSTITFPDSAGVVSVACVSQYAVAVRADTGRMYFLNPGTSTWDALDYFSAEAEPDPVIAVRKVGNELWAFGSSTVQPFAFTGNTDAPFQAIEGREYLRGCRSRATITALDNTVFWVGDDGIVYRAGPEGPQRVSDHGIEERIAQVAATGLKAWSWPWDGHTFMALTIGSEGTFVFDAATGQWHEAASYGLSAWRAHLGVTDDLAVYAGDSINGTVWQFDRDALMDGTDPIEQTFTAGLEVPSPVPCDSVEIEASVGWSEIGEAPVVEMRYSDDWGNTWSAWRQASFGTQGQYRRRVLWRRLGLVDRARVFEFRKTDAAPWRLSSVRMNESFGGGRAR